VRSLAFVVLTVSLAAAGCDSGAESEPALDKSEPAPIAFVPADGWNTVMATIAVGEETSAVAWASTGVFSPEDEGAGFPDATVQELPSGEIVISALGPRPFTGEADFPQLADDPLVIGSDECISRAYDGQPAPHITLCHLDRWVGQDRVLNVEVWLGARGPGQIPSEDLLAAANEQLGRLVVDDSA
jgi:hypothetical protein